MRISGVSIALAAALRVKSAEYWLALGLPFQALRELEELPRRARRHPWAAEVYLSAMETARAYYALGFKGLGF